MKNFTISNRHEALLGQLQRSWQVVDSTKLQCFARCPRQYFFEYILGWRPEKGSVHLAFGQAWHSALEFLYSTKDFTPGNIQKAFSSCFMPIYSAMIGEGGEKADGEAGGKTSTNALLALIEYCNQYAADLYTFEPVALEVTDTLPISTQFQLTVKLDMLVRYLDSQVNERLLIVEHKTGRSAGRDWAAQWHSSLQVGSYQAACWQTYGFPVDCLIDGVFFLKTKRTFQRELVQKSERQLKVWGNTVLSLFERMQGEWERLEEDDPSEEVMHSFPLNPVSCGSFSGCPYHDLCIYQANPLSLMDSLGGRPPIGFKIEHWNPLSSDSGEAEGKEII